ncbi:MAG: hypothetical protein QM757_38180 [Paludibaculum sp.]
MGLFNDENRPQMVKNLAESVRRENRDDGGVVRPPNSLMTGFIGTSWINKALSDHGLSELSYRLLLNNQYPSWLYAIDQGATSIWERLNGYTVENGFGGNNSMNSFNHYSFGAVGQWMMAYSLGHPARRARVSEVRSATGARSNRRDDFRGGLLRLDVWAHPECLESRGTDPPLTVRPCRPTRRRRCTCRPARPIQ